MMSRSNAAFQVHGSTFFLITMMCFFNEKYLPKHLLLRSVTSEQINAGLLVCCHHSHVCIFKTQFVDTSFLISVMILLNTINKQELSYLGSSKNNFFST